MVGGLVGGGAAWVVGGAVVGGAVVGGGAVVDGAAVAMNRWVVQSLPASVTTTPTPT